MIVKVLIDLGLLYIFMLESATLVNYGYDHTYYCMWAGLVINLLHECDYILTPTVMKFFIVPISDE